MDFAPTEAQKAVGDLARKIFTDRVTPKLLEAVESEGEGISRALWADLANAGLLGVAIPEGAGGGGHGLLELCALLTEAGAALAPVPLWPTLVLGALPIADHGSDAQKARWLGGIVSGEVILSAALTEPASDDPLRPATTARCDGDAFLLDGRKLCVPAAHLAARILIPAIANDAVGLFLLDPRAPGVKTERAIATTGEPQLHLTLTGARISPDDVLVAPSARGSEALSSLIERATAALCAMELGIVERVLQMTAQHTATRQQFDRPIATFQAVAQRAADAYIDVETIRLATAQAIWRLSENLPASKEIAVAKYWASEAGHRVVYAAQHLHAGIGFDRSYPLHRYYLHSKQIELTLGGASSQLARLGAAMAGSTV